MKNKKITLSICLVLLTMAILLSSCSKSSGRADKSASSQAFIGSNDASISMDSQAVMPTAENTTAGENDIATQNNSDISQKIIKTSWYDIQAKEFGVTKENIIQKVSDLKGYVEYSNSNGTESEKNAQINMTVRIPAAAYDEFNQYLQDTYSVTSSGESATDVTTQYVDTDARLSSYKAQEKRLLELLDQAQTVEDMVAIEEKLGSIRTEIEALTAQLKNLDKQIDYSSVTVNIVQTETYKPKETDGFFAQVWEKILMAFDLLAQSAGFLIIAVVVALPYLAVAYLIYRIIKKKRAKAKQIQTNTATEEPAVEDTQADKKE